MATSAAIPHAQQREIRELFGFWEARFNHHCNNMQKALAPTILPSILRQTAL
jgi:hypothetical protein